LNRYGQLGCAAAGDGTALPVRVEGLEAEIVTHIATGFDHCIALVYSKGPPQPSQCLNPSESVYSWGLNEHGQLGHNDFLVRRTPKRVDLLLSRNIVAVYANGDNAAAVDGANGIWIR
jgi:hypothetical protein